MYRIMCVCAVRPYGVHARMDICICVYVYVYADVMESNLGFRNRSDTIIIVVIRIINTCI